MPNCVKSLKEICLNFIALNIAHLESFRQFPSLLAEELFEKCLKNGTFLQLDKNSIQSLNLFANEYSTAFFSSFKCPNLFFLNEYMEYIEILFLSLTHLDLSGCALGNDSKILPTLHSMKKLKILNISKNNLSDDGFRKLILPFAIGKKGFENLTQLDISFNLISLCLIKKIVKITGLKKLCISVKADDIAIINNVFELSDFFINEKDNLIEEVVNSGWGCKLISQLEEAYIQNLDYAKNNLGKKKLSRFYGLAASRYDTRCISSNSYRNAKNADFFSVGNQITVLFARSLNLQCNEKNSKQKIALNQKRKNIDNNLVLISKKSKISLNETNLLVELINIYK